MSLTVHAIDHIVLDVADVDVSATWYVAVLGMTREGFDLGHGKADRVSIRFGQQKINLRPVAADAADWFTGRHPKAGSDDLCFLTSADPQTVVAPLTAERVEIEKGPITKRGAHGPIRSGYCRDPDGNLIEIASYPT